MAKGKSNRESAAKKFDSIAKIISNLQLFPTEADADIEILRIEIWRELDPRSPYEEHLSEEIIQRILEVKRLRELRQTLLDTAFKAKACSALELSPADPRDGGEESDLYDKVISETRDAASIEVIDAKLAKYGTSLGILQLEAYQSIANEIEAMNKRLDLLEKKLRQLRQSLHAIQAERRSALSGVTS